MKEIGPNGIEAYFKREVKKAGGMTEKHVSPGRKGVPDQLATWDDGLMHLVELKAPRTKGKLREDQIRDHARREARGVRVFVLHTKALIDDYILTYRLKYPQARVPGNNSLLTCGLIDRRLVEIIKNNIMICGRIDN